MSTIRVARRRRYTSVDRTTINEHRGWCGGFTSGPMRKPHPARALDNPCPDCLDTPLSLMTFRARGILFWLLDKPDDWTTNSESIAKAGGEGRDAVRAALNELEAFGYLRREKYQGDRGRWVTECTIYEVPPEPASQASADPASVVPSSAGRTSDSQASSTESPSGTENEISDSASSGLFDSSPIVGSKPPWLDEGITHDEWMRRGRAAAEATG